MEHALHLPLGTGSRYVVISDCHRGEGTTNDNLKSFLFLLLFLISGIIYH